MHTAVIDLGTNTFHLLIVARKGKSFEIIARERRYVKLAEDGINLIGPDPFHRGLSTLVEFKKILDRHKVTKLKACGTAGLRTAKNGGAFIEQARELTGIQIDLIDGMQEAQFIYSGVRQTGALKLQKDLIMDIGGGSVEFIICDQAQTYFIESFPIGVAVLYKEFHNQEPIGKDAINKIDNFLKDQLSSLFQFIEENKISIENLIGASGTFDVISSFSHGAAIHDQNYHSVSIEKFEELYAGIICQTLQERAQNPTIPSSRTDMIVVALILINFILRRINSTEIIVSDYAMKEGILEYLID